MNYLIVMPRLTEIREQSYSFPLGIAYVTASLKATGRNVFTYNVNYKIGTIEELIGEVIRKNDIDVIATGGLTAQFWQLKEILDAARKAKPEIMTMVGGGIITSDPEAAMEALEIADYGMIGEGEITICELAEAIEGQRSRKSVKGLIYKENDRWIITAPREEISDLDALPYPDYEGFEFGQVLEKLPTDIYALGQGRFGFVSFGRSCPFQCTFCFHPSGSRYRKRSIDSVFQEIDYLIEKFNIRNIAVTDELFVKDPNDLNEFCRRIKQRNIGFVISLRVDMVNKPMLQLLKQSGCLSVSFGLESADNRILKSMKKHITVEQIDYALSLCNEIGLNTMGNFIFGDQEETIETYQNTIRWWKEHPQYLIALHLIVLYPGSELYKIACARGVITDRVQHIKDGCPYKNITKMSDEEYKTMAVEISMLPQGKTDSVKDAQVEYLSFGKVRLRAVCPHCNQENTWSGLDVFRSLGNVICEHCDYTMNLIVADYIGEQAERQFAKLSNHKIGIWPMTNSVRSLIEAVPSVLSDRVYFIDSAEMKQGAQYMGKTIHAPNILKEEQVDMVLITVTTSIATEIINTIKKEYPSVKQVFFAGDLIDPHFMSRVRA